MTGDAPAPTVRVFIAVWPGGELLDALEAIDRRLRRSGAQRLVARDARHVTLAFIGDIPPSDADGLCDALRGAVADVAPFRARATGIVMLPSERAPRLVACGFGGESGLDALRERVLDAAFEITPTDAVVRDMDRRAAHHITIHRAPGGRTISRDIRIAIASGRVPEPGDGWPPLVVDRVSFVRSVLTPIGPAYTRLAEIPLGRGPVAPDGR